MKAFKIGMICVCCLLTFSIQAQFYGLKKTSLEASNNYLLVESAFSTYLLDSCAKVVHTWANVFDAHLHSKLLEDGSLLYIYEGSLSETAIVRRDWNNNVIFEAESPEVGLFFQYEVILLPNGNYLSVGRRFFNPTQFEAIGYDVLGASPSVVDVVVEIDKDTKQIVWEWNISDHVIQDYDQFKPNFGNVSEHPELLNMGAIGTFDWNFFESFMINGMDYNPELDQIALSVRKMSEVVIIDHSTTTEEAKGSTGGNSGKGGDILYRFGNPQNYGRGTADDRVLYYQHNPNWIKFGPHEGKMMCYNNGLNRPVPNFDERYSGAPIFDPQEDGFNYVLDNNQAYSPLVPEISFDKIETGTDFYSGYTSGARFLENGNVLITEGVTGRVFEINDSGEIVWEYITPDVGGSGYLFRTEKYPIDYPAFAGRDLMTSGTVLEFPASTVQCPSTLSNIEEDLVLDFSIRNDQENLKLITQAQNYNYRVLDILGRTLEQDQGSGNWNIKISNYRAGIYFLQIESENDKYAPTHKFYKN